MKRAEYRRTLRREAPADVAGEWSRLGQEVDELAFKLGEQGKLVVFLHYPNERTSFEVWEGVRGLDLHSGVQVAGGERLEKDEIAPALRFVLGELTP